MKGRKGLHEIDDFIRSEALMIGINFYTAVLVNNRSVMTVKLPR